MIVCHEPGCNQMKNKNSPKFSLRGWANKVSKLRHFQAFPGPLFYTHTVWLFYVHIEEEGLVINFLWLELRLKSFHRNHVPFNGLCICACVHLIWKATFNLMGYAFCHVLNCDGNAKCLWTV